MSLYRVTRGAGPPLVALHGWGMNAAVWTPLLGGLGEHFEVTVIELPGHGASAPAPAADLRDWAESCLRAAPGDAHWLGWSLGGQVALQAAMLQPARVRGLSLIATTPRFVQDADWPCAVPADVFAQFGTALAAEPAATLLRFLGLQVRGADHARDTLRRLRAEIGRRPPASAAGLQQGLALLAETDLRDGLAALQCRVHWLFGARDALVPASIVAALPGLSPDALVDTIDGAGHAPLLSHPAECLECLLNLAA